MNQMKNRLQGLTLLDRAFTAMTDEELETLVASLDDEHREAIDSLCGARDGGFTDSSTRILAMRATAARGRINGGLEQITTLLCDQCLADCIEALGDHADNPTESELLEAAPALIEKYGVAAVRVMMAGSVAGEAPASVALTRLLKHDETLALPPVEHDEVSVLPPPKADDDIKAKRKAAKAAKQADARARREQRARARHG
ncbi:MAG TPA: hypothetical protein VLD86_04375 [Ilumatobacteraceae bacterium]|nr:hypothetical protein [Ilumatobacteraceae bacterium]